ncbi:MAG: hypothetical protein AAGF54_10995 [Pseudomonadota bacterium]
MDSVAEQDSNSIASHAIDYAIAASVGVFFALCAWLWIENGESLAIASALAGLPICF